MQPFSALCPVIIQSSLQNDEVGPLLTVERINFPITLSVLELNSRRDKQHAVNENTGSMHDEFSCRSLWNPDIEQQL